MHPLKLIICGLEHSGTTICLNLLKKHPSLDSGLECGVLKSESPRFIEEKWKNIVKDTWRVSNNDMNYVIDTDDFKIFYQRLLEKSSNIENKNVFIIDKTPFYIYILDDVIKKVPDVKIIVMRKTLDNQLKSFIKRGVSREKTIKLHKDNYKNVEILQNYYDNIKIVDYENLISNPNNVIKDMIEFIGLDFSSDIYNDNLYSNMIKY